MDPETELEQNLDELKEMSEAFENLVEQRPYSPNREQRRAAVKKAHKAKNARKAKGKNRRG